MTPDKSDRPIDAAELEMQVRLEAGLIDEMWRSCRELLRLSLSHNAQRPCVDY